jgi:hypothetical protein
MKKAFEQLIWEVNFVAKRMLQQPNLAEIGQSLQEATVTATKAVEWQPMETAPKNGREFLMKLSNGWRIIASAPGYFVEDPEWTYPRWSTTSSCLLMIHEKDQDHDNLKAIGWMELPE